MAGQSRPDVFDQLSILQPKTLTWLADLASEGIIPRSQIVPVDVFGIGSTRAKIDFWRHERLPLPLAYLGEEELADSLREALGLTETTAQNLNRAIWTMATRMLAADSGRKPKAEDVRSLADHLGAGRAYWSQLEGPFKRLLVELPDDKDEDGEYGVVQIGKWKSTLRHTLWEAFRESTRGMERSTRYLMPLALAERSLTAITHKYLVGHEEEARMTQQRKGERFVEHLLALADRKDLGALAALRRGLEGRPAQHRRCTGTWPHGPTESIHAGGRTSTT